MNMNTKLISAEGGLTLALRAWQQARDAYYREDEYVSLADRDVSRHDFIAKSKELGEAIEKFMEAVKDTTIFLSIHDMEHYAMQCSEALSFVEDKRAGKLGQQIAGGRWA